MIFNHRIINFAPMRRTRFGNRIGGLGRWTNEEHEKFIHGK